MRTSTLYGALLLALIRAAVSQDPNDFSDNCNYASPYPPYRNPEWLCDVCGREFLRGSAPFVCQPANATVRKPPPRSGSALLRYFRQTNTTISWFPSQFDDKPLGPVGSYQRINFTNFVTVSGALSAPLLPLIRPAVPPNFAKVPAGKTGVLDYAIDLVNYTRLGGFLSSFRYACAAPATRVAVPCVVTVKQTRVLGATPPFSFATDTFTFRSNGSVAGGLAASPTIRSGFQQCINATIQAKCPNGGPVDLYVDELLHGIIATRNDNLEG
ncbi:uncharacterized protein K489DRAFT_371263 [Dissoconium aciculare CBS 342.82]|uniref:Uncharacterized protein n=1 Tax=Dissoconium aciculare CBS 342.82 TaxID=1314786 RepID=A0A6J3M4L3_9PEZI|nr:uncharacterized protein K489DRAFT_371263 [Dissoconium aciculare CBS 342.82]KAF1822424.1 hypothetical protein K489DRAFT_371263 [Dissoconium aciculare CBS 342.82]